MMHQLLPLTAHAKNAMVPQHFKIPMKAKNAFPSLHATIPWPLNMHNMKFRALLQRATEVARVWHNAEVLSMRRQNQTGTKIVIANPIGCAILRRNTKQRMAQAQQIGSANSSVSVCRAKNINLPNPLQPTIESANPLQLVRAHAANFKVKKQTARAIASAAQYASATSSLNSK
jgi:hypothetical protein